MSDGIKILPEASHGEPKPVGSKKTTRSFTSLQPTPRGIFCANALKVTQLSHSLELLF